MSKITRIQPEFVDYIPETLEPGVLYISRRFSTAAHLCCSGCGSEVVTPLNPAKWWLTQRGGKVSLAPSIGNWSLPCQSHYWITDNQVRFAPAMSLKAIAAVKARDRSEAQRYAPPPPPRSWLRDLATTGREWLRSLAAWWKGR